MSNLLQQLVENITKNVMDQVEKILIPQIAKKYNIPESELFELIGNPKIKAVPVSDPPQKKTEKTLQEKVDEAKEKNRFYNISSSKNITDTKANREKYKFYDDLYIAGKEGDPKLESALEELGYVSESQESKENTQTEVQPQSEESSDSEKPVQPQPKKSEESSDSEKPVQPKKSEKSEDSSDSIKAPKKTFKDSSEESTELSPPKPVAKKLKEPVDEPTKSTDSSESEESPEPSPQKQVSVPVKYNKELKKWWNPEHGFLVEKQGRINVVSKKLVDGKVVTLGEKDIMVCKKNIWGFVQE